MNSSLRHGSGNSRYLILAFYSYDQLGNLHMGMLIVSDLLRCTFYLIITLKHY